MCENNDDIPRIIKPRPHDVFDIFISAVETGDIVDLEECGIINNL